MRKLAAGNWKMNGTSDDLGELSTLAESHRETDIDIVICPPAPLLSRAHQALKAAPIRLGGQACHADENGAHTGDISAEMLADAGADYVILGHSERRETYNEASEDVREMARAAWRAGLTAIVCMGESMAQRDADNTLDIIGGQLAASIPDDANGDRLVVAYEPIWAIGTGRVPTLVQITEVHDFIRARLIRRFGAQVGNAVRILYGGSVKPDNARAIFAVKNVDGALVGGASLKAQDFSGIITALERAG